VTKKPLATKEKNKGRQWENAKALKKMHTKDRRLHPPCEGESIPIRPSLGRTGEPFWDEKIGGKKIKKHPMKKVGK